MQNVNVDELLKLMIDKDASDLHLTVPGPPVFRIHGELIPQEDLPPLTAIDIVSMLEQVSTQEHRDTFREERELDFAYSVSGLARFRVNVLLQRGTMSLAFRIVPFEIPSIDELGLPQILQGTDSQAKRSYLGNRHCWQWQVDHSGSHDRSSQ